MEKVKRISKKRMNQVLDMLDNMLAKQMTHIEPWADQIKQPTSNIRDKQWKK